MRRYYHFSGMDAAVSWSQHRWYGKGGIVTDQEGGTATTNAPASDSDKIDGARSPEELETLLEDALLVGDRNALVDLFEEGAVLTVAGERSARRAQPVAELALATWSGDHSYVADPRQVIQARDVALVITGRGTNVARRDRDGAWRYVIVRQSSEDGTEEYHDIERRSGAGVSAGSRREGRG